MRVVRVREKSPEPEGLRRVCYAYGCVDLTGAGLEPYLLIRGVSSGRRSERKRPFPMVLGGRISPSALQAVDRENRSSVPRRFRRIHIVREIRQYYSAVDTFHGSRGLWFVRSTGVIKERALSARYRSGKITVRVSGSSPRSGIPRKNRVGPIPKGHPFLNGCRTS